MRYMKTLSSPSSSLSVYRWTARIHAQLEKGSASWRLSASIFAKRTPLRASKIPYSFLRIFYTCWLVTWRWISKANKARTRSYSGYPWAYCWVLHSLAIAPNWVWEASRKRRPSAWSRNLLKSLGRYSCRVKPCPFYSNSGLCKDICLTDYSLLFEPTKAADKW